MATRTARAIVPAERTRNITYAVRDVVLLAEKAAAAGRELLYLNVGDPNIFDFTPPEVIIEATAAAMRANRNGYAPSSGIPGARKAISADAEARGVTSIQHVYVTSGASEAIDLALAALANPGDNVLTPSPGYPLYTAVLARLEVENRGYYLDEGAGWQPDLEDIKSKIDDRTKALVLINPNNPTGSVCDEATLRAIIELCTERNIVLFSDEIYDKLVLGDALHHASAALPGAADAKIITFNGLSKSYLVPGFRIGWGIISGPADELEEYAEAIQKMERARLSANHPEQYAIAPALAHDAHLPEVCEKLTRRRDLTYDRLNAIDGVSCVKPDGAFYAFPKIDLGVPDSEFVARVIQETGVIIVPGSGFGQRPGTNHFRVVFLPPEDILDRAFDGIERIARECS